MKILLTLLMIPMSFSVQKPSQGKVLIHVSAAETGVYKGIQQRTPDMESSARELRMHLGKGKWSKVTNNLEESDIRIQILGRRKDPTKGIAIGYALDAGAYKTEDEVFDRAIESNHGGGAARDVRDINSESAQKSVVKYPDLALQFADQLDYFCQSNYERIVAQRK